MWIPVSEPKGTAQIENWVLRRREMKRGEAEKKLYGDEFHNIYFSQNDNTVGYPYQWGHG
jgi:hypothetical protein